MNQFSVHLQPLVNNINLPTGGYDERGLLGLASHPEFSYNGVNILNFSTETE